jgi:hypothetical protein
VGGGAAPSQTGSPFPAKIKPDDAVCKWLGKGVRGLGLSLAMLATTGCEEEGRMSEHTSQPVVQWVEKFIELRDNIRVGISSNRISLSPISEEDVWRHVVRLNDLKSLFKK